MPDTLDSQPSRVAVIDDDPAMRAAWSEYLSRKLGASILPVKIDGTLPGDDIVAETIGLASLRIQAVISDMQMPRITGAQVLKRLKKPNKKDEELMRNSEIDRSFWDRVLKVLDSGGLNDTKDVQAVNDGLNSGFINVVMDKGELLAQNSLRLAALAKLISFLPQHAVNILIAMLTSSVWATETPDDELLLVQPELKIVPPEVRPALMVVRNNMREDLLNPDGAFAGVAETGGKNEMLRLVHEDSRVRNLVDKSVQELRG